MIWLSSDPHFSHCKEFIWRSRGFSSVQDMNNIIVRNWNTVVKPDDNCYILGDIMLNNNEIGMNLLESLNGHIHIVLGNHDTDTRINLYKTARNVVEVDKAIDLKWKGFRFHLTHYPTITSNHDDYKTIDKKIVNLCGHSHCTDPFQDWHIAPIYHVELDAHYYYPVSLDEIIKDIFDWRKY